MKRIFSLLLVVVLLCALFVGCSSKDTTSDPADTDATSDVGTNKEPTENETTQPSTEGAPNETQPTESEEEKLAAQKAQYEQYLSEIKIELLSVDRALPFSESFWENGFYVDQKYGGVGTMMTVGIDWGSKDVYNIAYGISIGGETATDPDDSTKEAFQYDDMFTVKDKTYSIITFIVQGDVDPAKAHLLIKTKLDDVYKEFKFDNDGQPVGYATAIEKYSSENDNMGMDSGIIKLKDRHYKVIYRGQDNHSWTKFVDYENEDPSKGVNVFTRYKLSLLPLEGGNRETLKTEDVSGSYIDESLRRDDIKFTYSVSRENTFGGADPIHTVIEIEAKYTINEPAKLTEDGYIDDSQYKEQEKELKNSISYLQFVTKDENGEVETVFQLLKSEN